MLERAGFMNTNEKLFKGSQKAWGSIFKPAVNVASPLNVMAVSAKTKYPQVAQATTNNSKSISRGKVLCLTDLHGNGLRLKVMYILFQLIFVKKMDDPKRYSKCENDFF